MSHWEAHKALMKLWEDTVHGYFDILEAAMGAHHTDEITTKQDAASLRDAFKSKFGRDGDQILGKLVTSPEFNGGGDPEAEKSLYPGMVYSIPLSFYLARRALDLEDNETAYDIFVNDIDSFAKQNDIEIKPNHYPSQAFMEMLMEPALEELSKLHAPEMEGEDNQAALG